MPLVYSYKPSTDYYIVSGLNFTDLTTSIPNFYDDGSNGNKPIREIADFAFFGANSLLQAFIPSGIIKIGDSAFKNCQNLKDLFILDSPTRIGKEAFRNCYNLTGVIFGNKTHYIDSGAFYDADSLRIITFPDSLTGIGPEAFRSCGVTGSYINNQTSFLYLPTGLEYLGPGAFRYNWPYLKEVRIPSPKLKYLPDGVFQECFQLRECIFYQSGLTGIGARAFKECSSLTGMSLPNTATGNILIETFFGCTSLQYINIPSGATSIEESSFNSCARLKRIDLPPTLRSIGREAFALNYSLGSTGLKPLNFATSFNFVISSYPSNIVPEFTGEIPNIKFITGLGTGIGDPVVLTGIYPQHISLPTGLNNLGVRAFVRAQLPQTLLIPRNLTYIENDAFANSPFNQSEGLENLEAHPNNSTYSACSGLLYNKTATALVFCPRSKTGVAQISGSTSNINSYAFYDCLITGVNFPTSLTSIGTSAFNNSRIKEAFIPSNVSSISSAAFFSCTSLTGAILPTNPNYGALSDDLFGNCYNLRYINIPNNVLYLNNNVFSYNYKLQRMDIGSGLNWAENMPLLGTTFGINANYDGLEHELTGIFVHPDNPYMCDISGVVYTKNSGILIRYPHYKIVLDGYSDVDGFGNILKTYSPPNYTTGIGYGAFSLCTKLKKVLLNDNIRKVRSYAFYSCTDLREITFNTSELEQPYIISNSPYLTGLKFAETGKINFTPNSYYFNSMPSLKTVYLPSGISGFGGQTLAGISNLTGYNVSLDNPYISSQNGILYNKNKTQIINIPPALVGDITIPDQITGIGADSFTNSAISSITIGTGIKYLGQSTFVNMPNLTGIVFGDSITGFGRSTIYNCQNLKEIYFGKNTKYFFETFAMGVPELRSIIYPTGNFIITSQYYAGGIGGSWYENNGTGQFLEKLSTPWYYDISWGIYRRYVLFGANQYGFATGEFPLTRVQRYSIDQNNNAIINYIDINYSNFLPGSTEMIIPSGLRNRKIVLLSGISSQTGVFSKNDLLLKNIIIPSGIKIGQNISFGISGLKELTGINVNNDNPYLFSKDGILYNKNQTEIIAVPSKSSIDHICFNNNFNLIRSEAFAYNTGILKLNFKGNAPQIGQYIFTGTNPNLKIYRKKDAVSGWQEYLDNIKVYYGSENFIKTNGQPNKFYISKNGNGKLTTFYNC